MPWSNVCDYHVSYRDNDYHYADSIKIVTDDGYGTIAEDEITEHDKHFLKAVYVIFYIKKSLSEHRFTWDRVP